MEWQRAFAVVLADLGSLPVLDMFGPISSHAIGLLILWPFSI